MLQAHEQGQGSPSNIRREIDQAVRERADTKGRTDLCTGYCAYPFSTQGG